MPLQPNNQGMSARGDAGAGSTAMQADTNAEAQDRVVQNVLSTPRGQRILHPPTHQHDPQRGGITDQELYPIALRDVTSFANPWNMTVDQIVEWFERYRRSKGKDMDVPEAALRASWNAFARIWNQGRVTECIKRWEAEQRRYSLSALRAEVHRLCDSRRRVCYVDVVEGCRESATRGGSRPDRAGWNADTRRGLDEDIRLEIG